MIVVAVVVVGMSFVPYLIAEERETRTLQVLLVSPASIGQVVAGKALAGAAYCLTGGGVVIALNYLYVVHWEVILASILCGTALAVALGLLLGILIAATFLVDMASLPAPLRWVPTVAMAHALRLSFAESVPAARLAADLRGAGHGPSGVSPRYLADPEDGSASYVLSWTGGPMTRRKPT
jgi:ABC-type Na+ efflux pump permease subunit